MVVCNRVNCSIDDGDGWILARDIHAKGNIVIEECQVNLTYSFN